TNECLSYPCKNGAICSDLNLRIHITDKRFKGATDVHHGAKHDCMRRDKYSNSRKMPGWKLHFLSSHWTRTLTHMELLADFVMTMCRALLPIPRVSSTNGEVGGKCFADGSCNGEAICAGYFCECGDGTT
ncbi:hypothetical protein MAR_022457, partial [Mya arenaria]